jgi:hypothetical protein
MGKKAVVAIPKSAFPFAAVAATIVDDMSLLDLRHLATSSAKKRKLSRRDTDASVSKCMNDNFDTFSELQCLCLARIMQCFCLARNMQCLCLAWLTSRNMQCLC